MDWENDLAIAKRENNQKRNYLVINRKQGKHHPGKPGEMFDMCNRLAELVKKAYTGQKLLIIGFAETATAIGAALAAELNSLYLQTTREDTSGVSYLYFFEAHSHATEQKLIREDLKTAVADGIDRIVFAEDELTTGNTILGAVDVIRQTFSQEFSIRNIGFSAVSVLNSMDEKAFERYRIQGIDLHYLVRTDHSEYSRIAEHYEPDGEYYEPSFDEIDSAQTDGTVTEFVIPGPVNARRLLSGTEYRRQCVMLAEEIAERIGLAQRYADEAHDVSLDKSAGVRAAVSYCEDGSEGISSDGPDGIRGVLQRHVQFDRPDGACEVLQQRSQSEGNDGRQILVLGTEEFTYPAFCLAKLLEDRGFSVQIHSTTRSPIEVSSAPEYPLHRRHKLASLYDSERVTFIYELKKYDKSIILTDAEPTSRKGICSLINALRSCGNDEIYLVRWKENAQFIQ